MHNVVGQGEGIQLRSEFIWSRVANTYSSEEEK